MSSAIQSAPVALIRKLDEKLNRFKELESELSDPAVLSNAQRLVSISKEKGRLEQVVGRYEENRKAMESLDQLKQLAENKADAEMAELPHRSWPKPERRRPNCWSR